MGLMLEFLLVLPGYFPSFSFPQSRLETRIQGQVVYWEVQVTAVEKDMLCGRSASGHRVCGPSSYHRSAEPRSWSHATQGIGSQVFIHQLLRVTE